MLFDLYDIPFEAQAVYLLFGGVLGVLFGALALLTRFCLRQAVTGESAQGMAAKSVWATAFIAAVLGNLALEYAGFIELSEHRLFAPNL
ncbi:MAG TPA: YeeE/YedE family protein, partial [Rhodobacteraceae bacterium]|nr:YeeE/YedE family protein [Paracoccaceae bacterium]